MLYQAQSTPAGVDLEERHFGVPGDHRAYFGNTHPYGYNSFPENQRAEARRPGSIISKPVQQQ